MHLSLEQSVSELYTNFFLICVGSPNDDKSFTHIGSIQETSVYSLKSEVQDILDEQPEVFGKFCKEMDKEIFGNGWKRLAYFSEFHVNKFFHCSVISTKILNYVVCSSMKLLNSGV